jgi:hypothetical protein
MTNKSYMSNKESSRGQALIPVLVVLIITLTLGAGLLYLNIGGMLIGSYTQEGERVLLATEGALENGLLRVLRNPAYLGESLQVNGVDCTISLSGQAPIVMTAECQSTRAERRLQTEVSFINGEMLVDNLVEIE